MGTFDFDTLHILQVAAPLVVAPVVQRRPMYACMTHPPLSDETRLTEADPQGCPLKAWSVDIHRVLARRTQGGCAAAREAMTHE